MRQPLPARTVDVGAINCATAADLAHHLSQHGRPQIPQLDIADGAFIQQHAPPVAILFHKLAAGHIADAIDPIVLQLSLVVTCHTFRATGITAYLENDGMIEHAQAIPGSESPRTTKLYDRTSDAISLDEMEKIVIGMAFSMHVVPVPDTSFAV